MTLQVKAIIGAVLFAIIAGLGWFGYHMVHVWADQKMITGEQTTVIKDQSQTIQLNASSAAITDAATANAASQAQAVQDTQGKIDQSTEAQIKNLAQQYAGQTMTPNVTYTPVTPSTASPAPKPVPVTVPATTPSQPTPYEVAVSQVRITGVWQTYCAGNPSDPDCQGVPAPQAQ
jgi:hypothetical protein